jgi:ankyrin repeat protein
MNKGADVKAKTRGGKTSLKWAAEIGNYYTVNVLLDAGTDVNLKNKEGKRALMYAAEEGHTKIVELLKQAEAEE